MKSRTVEIISAFLLVAQALILIEVFEQQASWLVTSLLTILAAILWYLILKRDEDFGPIVLVVSGMLGFCIFQYLNSIGVQLPTKGVGNLLPVKFTLAAAYISLSFSLAGFLKWIGGR